MKTILISVLMFLTLAAVGCGDDKGVFHGEIYEKHRTITAKGVQVRSGQEIPTALLPEIDAGLDDLFRIAAGPPNGYAGFSTHANYTVWLMPRSPKCVNPSFLIDASHTVYEGSEWDKNPDPEICELCVAGMLILNGTLPGMMVADDLGQMRTIVRYEGEHNLLLEVDRERFAATQYHIGPNSGHPILGEGESLVGPRIDANGAAVFYDGKTRQALLTK